MASTRFCCMTGLCKNELHKIIFGLHFNKHSIHVSTKRLRRVHQRFHWRPILSRINALSSLLREKIWQKLDFFILPIFLLTTHTLLWLAMIYFIWYNLLRGTVVWIILHINEMLRYTMLIMVLGNPFLEFCSEELVFRSLL